MAKRSFSGPNESVFTTTVGCPAVLNESCEQPISSFGNSPVCVQVKSDSILVSNIFQTPVTPANWLRPTHDHDVPTHLNEELDYRRLSVAPVLTPPSFSVLDYMNLYPTSFDVVRFRHMHTACNQLQGRGHLGKLRNKAVGGWAKRWNHYGDRGALDCRCVGEETDSLFVQCRQEVDYENRLVALLAWMRGKVMVSEINLILIISLCPSSFTTCGSSTFTNTGSANTISTCICVLIFG